ncbi:MAG: hypothetical protein HY896_05475 [Deltaproteobacteria bacterium]|nr:hypothetical protein [Deltaproteobacteria bacterium]
MRSFVGSVSIAQCSKTHPASVDGVPFSFLHGADGKSSDAHDKIITVPSRKGKFGAFGGLPIEEKEADRWLDDFSCRGHEYLLDIRKPVWSFVWDDERKEAVIAVDRFRINWLYWLEHAGRIHFSPSIADLLQYLRISFDPDPNALFAYLDLLCVPAEMSMQRGMGKLGGGRCIVIKDGSASVRRYHRFSFREKLKGDIDSLGKIIRAGIERSVGERLSWVGDSKAGCFLSGGTDSSTLLGFSSRISGPGFPAFSVSFSEDRWNELEYASLAAKTFDADHKIIPFSMEDAWRFSETLAKRFDEPLGNPSLLATCKCVEEASLAGVEYMIAGDGGDEIFGGNERYASEYLYSRFNESVPGFLRKLCMKGAGYSASVLDFPLLGRAQRILERADRKNPERYYLEDAFAYKIFPSAFRKEFAEAINPEICLEIFSNYYSEADAGDDLDRLLHIDMYHTLGDNDLVKVGMAGRINGVGILYPMLGDALVDDACRLPCWAKLKGREKRHAFKVAMTGFVPEKILYKKKHGFGVPISHWIRNSKPFSGRIAEVLFDGSGLVLKIVKQEELKSIFRNHVENRIDAGMFLWGLYYLNIWHRNISTKIK